MQNNFFGSKLNTVLLLILIILMVFAIKIMRQNQEMYLDLWKTPTEEKTSINSNELNQPDMNGWAKSPKFGLYYPKDVEIFESFETFQNPSTEYATAYFTYDKAIISWGGQNTECMDNNQFGKFESGVSVVGCVRGLRTQVGVVNARDEISQQAINIFGEFVLKNQ